MTELDGVTATCCSWKSPLPMTTVLLVNSSLTESLGYWGDWLAGFEGSFLSCRLLKTNAGRGTEYLV